MKWKKSTKFQKKWPLSSFIILWMVACNISLTWRTPQAWDPPHVREMLHAIFTQNTTSYFPLPSHLPTTSHSKKANELSSLSSFVNGELSKPTLFIDTINDLRLTRSILIFNGSYRFLFVALSLSVCFLWFLFYSYGRIHIFLCWIQNFWILTWGRWYFLFVTYYR